MAVNNHGPGTDVTLNIRHGAYLPHWTLEDATYFITFRLADSLPKQVLESWLFEREKIVKTAEQMGRALSIQELKRLHKLHSDRVENYLDAGHGACFMKEDPIAATVANALKHFDGERYDVAAWCIMPNHVHAVVRPHQGQELPDILHTWKPYTANRANKQLGRTGEFWQTESYDHVIRDEMEFWSCVEYVLNNPANVGLRNWKWVGVRGTSAWHGHPGRE